VVTAHAGDGPVTVPPAVAMMTVMTSTSRQLRILSRGLNDSMRFSVSTA
jgi:hypothetical protein